MSLVSKAFSDIVTFSRSSNATRIGPTGRVEYAPHNLLVRSQEFDNASWTKDGTTVTSNSIAAPDGSITADKLVEDSSTGNHWAYASISNTNTTISVYAKAAERNFVALACAGEGLCYFNLSTGAVVSTAANCSTSITSVGNGWYRCVVSATGTGSFGILGVSANGTTVSYAGTTGSGVYIWGAQLSVGPYALDYTPTTSAAVYGPRFDYDPVTLAARGLLIEEQRSNVLTYSEQFDNGAWTNQNSSETANAATAPDGTTTADRLVDNTTNGVHDIYFTSGNTLSAAFYTASIFLKKDTLSKALLVLATASYGYGGGVYVDLNSGTISSVVNYGGHTGASATITNVGNGWYRVTLSITGTAATYYTALDLVNSAGNNTYTGDGSGLFLWGAQLEAGSFATSYIPTVAASVTRSADVASVNTLSPWFNSECTIYAEASVLPGNVNNNTKIIFGGGATGNSPALLEYIGSLQTLVQGVNFPVSASTTLSSSPKKISGAFKPSDHAISVNGALVTSTLSSSVGSGSAFYIGSSSPGTTDHLNGHIRRIAFYPRRLTNAELQSLTS